MAVVPDGSAESPESGEPEPGDAGDRIKVYSLVAPSQWLPRLTIRRITCITTVTLVTRLTSHVTSSITSLNIPAEIRVRVCMT